MRMIKKKLIVIDIDECVSNPCQHGTCVNTQGNFQCTCSQGFNLGPDGRSCIDNSKDLCYSQFKDGQCYNPMSNPVTKSSCCCSGSHYQNFGWGTPCRQCPIFGSHDYLQLCPHGPGMSYSGVGSVSKKIFFTQFPIEIITNKNHSFYFKI